MNNRKGLDVYIFAFPSFKCQIYVVWSLCVCVLMFLMMKDLIHNSLFPPLMANWMLARVSVHASIPKDLRHKKSVCACWEFLVERDSLHNETILGAAFSSEC